MSALLFDGTCGFCTSCANWATTRIISTAKVVAYQRADLAAFGLSVEQCAAAVQYVDDDGRIHQGAAAVARFLSDSDGAWKPVGRTLMLPGIRRIAQVVYLFIARNRHRLPGGTPACASDLSD